MGTSRTRTRRLGAAVGAVALGAVLALPAGAWSSAPEDDGPERVPAADEGEPEEENGERTRSVRGGGGDPDGGSAAAGADSDTEPAREDGRTQAGGPDPDADGPGDTSTEEAEPDDDGPDATDADRPDADRPETCDPLVTHTPRGSTGDRDAVAITSQSLEQGRAGWAHVSWEAAAGTTVDEVHVVRDEETEHLTEGDLRTGTAEDVLELRFCGRAAGDDGRSGSDEPDGPDDDPSAEDPRTGGGSSGESGSDGTGEGSGGDPAPDGATATPETPAGGEASTPTAQNGAAEEDDEVEVLGVQLTAEEDGTGDTEVLGTTLARTGAEVPVLAAAGAAIALLGLTVLLRTRGRVRRTL